VPRTIHNISSIKVEEIEKALNLDENNYEAFSSEGIVASGAQRTQNKSSIVKRRNIQGGANGGRRSTL
jgi:hypothetical protein